MKDYTYLIWALQMFCYEMKENSRTWPDDKQWIANRYYLEAKDLKERLLKEGIRGIKDEDS